MPNKRKDLRSSRANPASSGVGKKRAAGKKAARQPAWQRTWLRVLLILTVVALPLLAAALAGPTIRGGSRWQGILKGMHITTQDKKADSSTDGSADDNSGATTGGQASFGQVGVRLFNPITRGRLLAEFDLDGVAVLEDGPELKNIIKNKYRFVREQATIAVRNSTAAELADPKLKMLKRRVLIRINRSLERPLLKSVNLAHFSLSEATPEMDLLGDDEEQSQ